MASKLRAIAFLLLCLSASPAVLEAQGFNQVFTQDGFDVWAVGDGGEVYRSLDGGASWSSYPLGIADNLGIAARGSRVWIVNATGTLWTSVDGGASFSSQTPAGPIPLRSICFIDETTGWIAGGNGTILKSTDGGATWSPQVSSTSASISAIRFKDPFEGWACGSGGTVLHTTDGGATWFATTPFAFSKDLYDIDFQGSTVYVAGTYSFFAKSTNAGATWTPVDLKITSKSDVNGVAIQPNGTLWLCGGGGFLRRSTDGGGSFTYPLHPIMTGMMDVVFHDDLKGWACAAWAKIVARTTDGGQTWTVPGGGAFTYTWSMKLGSGGTIVRGNTLTIDPVNRDKLYVVQGMNVYASWDRGENWRWIASIGGVVSRCNAFLVSPTDTLTWLALVKPYDRITRTTDGGLTWTPTIEIPYSEYGLPMEQDPSIPQHVYFGPEDGKMWKSTDFGATWFELSNPAFRSPDDIAVVPETTGVIYVGDGITGVGNAKIWKSSDGGLTWQVKRTVTGSEVPMISVSRLDKFIAYATDWPFGGVQRTLDMGETWPDVATTPSGWGTDIAKDDPNVATYAVYSGNATYLSINRGQSFLTATVSGSNYGSLDYDRATHLVHQSTGVWKATIHQPDMPILNAQAIELIAPNAGEVWQYGDPEKISWWSQSIAKVRIELQTNPVGPWQLITSSALGPSGQYPWTAPNEPTNAARMRVSDAVDGTPMDHSDGTFSIVVPGIACQPARLDFGETSIGWARRDSIAILNNGTAPLVVSNVSKTGSGPFTPVRTSFSVPVGSTAQLVVIFEPIAEQLYTDTLVIACNAPSTPVLVPLSGSGTSAPVAVGPGAPRRFELHESVPNPFSADGTVISYSLPVESDVSLVVYNVLGQMVARLIDGRQSAGRYAVRFPDAASRLSHGSASLLPSGVYFCRLKAGGFVANRRMVLIR